MESCIFSSVSPLPSVVPPHRLQPAVCYTGELIDPSSVSQMFMRLRERENHPRKSLRGSTTAGSSRLLRGYVLGPFGVQALHYFS